MENPQKVFSKASKRYFTFERPSKYLLCKEVVHKVFSVWKSFILCSLYGRLKNSSLYKRLSKRRLYRALSVQVTFKTSTEYSQAFKFQKKFVQGFFKRFSPYRRLSKDVLPIKALTNLFKGFLCEDGLQKVFSPIRKSLKVLFCKDDLQIER